MGRQSKKLLLASSEAFTKIGKADRMQGAQILRNEAYIEVRRNKPAPLKSGEGCSAIPRNVGLMDFLRSRQD